MDFGHYAVAANDDYVWPYKALKNQPNSWALTALGTLPTLTGLTPDRATAGGSAFQMVITGTNFLTNTVVLWDGNPVPATFSSSTEMPVKVGAPKMQSGASRMKLQTLRLFRTIKPPKHRAISPSRSQAW